MVKPSSVYSAIAQRFSSRAVTQDRKTRSGDDKSLVSENATRFCIEVVSFSRIIHKCIPVVASSFECKAVVETFVPEEDSILVFFSPT